MNISVFIFNYNKNEGARMWYDIMSKHFNTRILDSGSEPPCHGEGVVRYPNIYYGGMFNEAMRLSDGSDWVCIITSDLVINDANKERIVSRMLEAVKIPEIGCYQPSCDKRGRSHSHGYNQPGNTMRRVPYFEGWFHLFRRELGFNVDLSLNRNGWGTDLYLCKRAIRKGLSNVVDDSVIVLHPSESGLNSSESREQMAKWAATLPDWENKIKVGLAINTFEGTEHIESIVREIRSSIDKVVILMQTESYLGIPADEEDIKEVKTLKRIGLVDEIIYFPRILYMPPREQETVKRNQGMCYLQQNGCDYVIVTDSDEFYTKAQFDYAKNYVREWLPEATYCYYINYYKDDQHILLDDCFCERGMQRGVPFLCKSGLRFQFSRPTSIPSDLTRRIASGNITVFQSNTIQMRHYSYVRKNIRKKVKVWSLRSGFSGEDFDNIVRDYESFDGSQRFVSVPHKAYGNKVEVLHINELGDVYSKEMFGARRG